MQAQFEILDRRALPRIRSQRALVFRKSQILEHRIDGRLRKHARRWEESDCRRRRTDARDATRGSIHDWPAESVWFRCVGCCTQPRYSISTEVVRSGL